MLTCGLLCRVFEHQGVKLVTDDVSLEFIKGATVDYVSELIKSTFEVRLCSCRLSTDVSIRSAACYTHLASCTISVKQIAAAALAVNSTMGFHEQQVIRCPIASSNLCVCDCLLTQLQYNAGKILSQRHGYEHHTSLHRCRSSTTPMRRGAVAVGARLPLNEHVRRIEGRESEAH